MFKKSKTVGYVECLTCCCFQGLKVLQEPQDFRDIMVHLACQVRLDSQVSRDLVANLAQQDHQVTSVHQVRRDRQDRKVLVVSPGTKAQQVKTTPSIIRLHRMRSTRIWTIATEGVAWSVCVSVRHDGEPCANG